MHRSIRRLAFAARPAATIQALAGRQSSATDGETIGMVTDPFVGGDLIVPEQPGEISGPTPGRLARHVLIALESADVSCTRHYILQEWHLKLFLHGLAVPGDRANRVAIKSLSNRPTHQSDCIFE